jgi:hypothetical protein
MVRFAPIPARLYPPSRSDGVPSRGSRFSGMGIAADLRARPEPSSGPGEYSSMEASHTSPAKAVPCSAAAAARPADARVAQHTVTSPDRLDIVFATGHITRSAARGIGFICSEIRHRPRLL